MDLDFTRESAFTNLLNSDLVNANSELSNSEIRNKAHEILMSLIGAKVEKPKQNERAYLQGWVSKLRKKCKNKQKLYLMLFKNLFGKKIEAHGAVDQKKEEKKAMKMNATIQRQSISASLKMMMSTKINRKIEKFDHDFNKFLEKIQKENVKEIEAIINTSSEKSKEDKRKKVKGNEKKKNSIPLYKYSFLCICSKMSMQCPGVKFSPVSFNIFRPKGMEEEELLNQEEDENDIIDYNIDIDFSFKGLNPMNHHISNYTKKFSEKSKEVVSLPKKEINLEEIKFPEIDSQFDELTIPRPRKNRIVFENRK